MTVRELSKLYWLKREVEMNKKQLNALRQEITRDATELNLLRSGMDGLHSPNLDAMPHGNEVNSAVESTVVHIMALEERLRYKHEAELNLEARLTARQTLCVLEQAQLELYISSVDDSYLRQIFTLRFVNGLTWQEVAQEIGQPGIWESVRQKCYRYVRDH